MSTPLPLPAQFNFDKLLTHTQVVMKILREMGEKSSKFNLKKFRYRLEQEKFDRGQQGPLKLRLSLLESFLESANAAKGAQSTGTNVWQFAKGSLTIIDLSCPFVDEPDACSLFNICVNIFLTQRSQCSRIVALDEAHKVRQKTRRKKKKIKNLTPEFAEDSSG